MNSSCAAGAGLAPRTAEPAAPQPVALSAWKQQQLASLSAGFHSRQRRLLELLSACNRVTQAQATPTAGAPAAAAAAVPGSSAGAPGKAGRAAAATAGAAKPPLGPRAAAVAAASCWAAASTGDGRAARGGMGRALGRLKDQRVA